MAYEVPNVNRFIKELNYYTPVCSSPLKIYDEDSISDRMDRFQEWTNLENKVKKFVKQNLILDGNLRQGTKLYHSTLNPDLDFSKFDKNMKTFFGLDIVISLWYILEMAEAEKEKTGNFPIYGYLYEFELSEPLKVDKYIETIGEHPTGVSECEVKLGVCVHPQITFHGLSRHNQGPFDLSIEVTMGNNSLSYLLLVKKYKVLVRNLKNFRSYPLTSLDIISYIERGDDMLTFVKINDLKNVEMPIIPSRQSITKNFFNMRPKRKNSIKTLRKSRKTSRKSYRKSRKTSRKSYRKSRKTSRKSYRKSKKTSRKLLK